MSKLIVNTIEAQTYKYDSDTTGLTLNSDGYAIKSKKPSVIVDMSQTSGSNVYVSVSAGDPIPFGYVVEGDSSLINTSTYKFQCPVDGLYFISYYLHCNTAAVSAFIVRNTTRLGLNWNNDDTTMVGSMLISCDAEDEVWLESQGSDSYYNGGGSGGSGSRYTFASFGLVS